MGQRTVLATIALIIFVIIFVALFVLSRIQPRTDTKKADAAPAVVKQTVDAADVIDDPLVYDGLRVTVEAPISDWVTKKSFTLSTGGGILNANKQLLVVRKQAFKLPKDSAEKEVGLGETVSVRIKGRVRIVSREELSIFLGLDVEGEDIKLDDNNIANWAEGSILLADSVEKL
ncbi:MAG: hypothetical protein HY426_04900 [Candidatus Levybacteria bacterium]|nr:hypothetical protein [Candidatus Levybacteria bacterium]